MVSLMPASLQHRCSPDMPKFEVRLVQVVENWCGVGSCLSQQQRSCSYGGPQGSSCCNGPRRTLFTLMYRAKGYVMLPCCKVGSGRMLVRELGG